MVQPNSDVKGYAWNMSDFTSDHCTQCSGTGLVRSRRIDGTPERFVCGHCEGTGNEPTPETLETRRIENELLCQEEERQR